MTYIHGNPSARGPLSPYAGLHPALAERAKQRAARDGLTPAEAIARERDDLDALTARILAAPWTEERVLDYCRQRWEQLRALPENADVTLTDVRAGVYTELRRGGVEAQRIVAAVTGMIGDAFEVAPNGELTRP